MKLRQYFRLSVLLAALGALPLALSGANFKHITIDGSFADWAGVPPAHSDPEGDAAGATDIKDVYIAHDAEFVYVRFTLYAPGDPFTAQNNFFFNADGNSASGFNPAGQAFGSEMLIQSGAGYQERGGGFNEGSINGLGWAAAPAGEGTDYEFRVSRGATYASDGSQVFASDTIAILLEAETANFTPVEFAPEGSGAPYELTTPPPAPPPGSQPLITLSATDWAANDGGTDLETAWRDLGYDVLSEPSWAGGFGLLGYTPAPEVYPAPVLTPLTPGQPTYYFRALFQWDYDPAGILLLVSNYLSDGAVFYLNGMEVERLRITDQPVTFNSPATGGPPVPGQVEFFVLPATALVVGENVMAVEVHQTSGDNADLVFGLSLTATDGFPVIITNPAEPADRLVEEGTSTTFTVEATGSAPITYQWCKDGAPIPDATNAIHSILFVLQSDAGNYSVKVSNPVAANVTSRMAVLTTFANPVTITNDTQPADRTIMEGQSTSFIAPVTGSAPIFFQWFKDGQPVAGATNATYEISSAEPDDAGDYFVVASNRAPPAATSRTAQLTVLSDRIPPTVIQVSGSPNRIILIFSEPLDAASAGNVANYTADNGLAVTNAVLEPTDFAGRVVLATSAQTLGTVYTVTLNGVMDSFDNVIQPNTQVFFKSTVVIDGSFDDWADVPLAFSDPQDTTEAVDYKDAFVWNDDNFIYVRITLHMPGDPAIFYNNLFVDADNDPVSGYHPFGGMGSEMLIQGGSGYQEKNGVFNEGEIVGLDWAIVPEGTGTDFEFRFSRHARYASDNLPVFTRRAIGMALESEDTSFITKDIAPDSGVFSYVFQPLALEPLLLRRVNEQIEISWIGPGVLQSRPSLSPISDWEDEPDQNNPQFIPLFDDQRFYRLIQR